MITFLRSIVVLGVTLLNVWDISAQSALLSFSGTYGIIASKSPSQTLDKGGAGIQLGLEYPFKRRLSFGGELQWQSVEPYSAVAVPVSPISGKPDVAYYVKNNQLSASIQARYYLKQALKGFYLGVFGTFLIQLTSYQGYPDDGAYPDVSIKNADKEYRGGGISYGCRFRFNPSLGAHVYLWHQFLWNNNNPDIRQQHHFVGLGVNYAF